VEECGPCPVFVSYTLAFALQLRKKHGKTSVRVRKTSVRVQYTYYQNTHILHIPHKHTYYKTYTYTHTHTTQQYKTTTVQIRTKCIEEKQHNGEKEQYLVSNVCPSPGLDFFISITSMANSSVLAAYGV
jgi:hypothetical protein